MSIEVLKARIDVVEERMKATDLKNDDRFEKIWIALEGKLSKNDSKWLVGIFLMVTMSVFSYIVIQIKDLDAKMLAISKDVSFVSGLLKEPSTKIDFK